MNMAIKSLSLISTIALFFFFYLFHYPKMGVDLSGLIPSVMEINDYMQKSFSIMHWSRMCGGIPYFAAPQSAQYCLFQFLLLFLPTIWALVINLLVHILIGYVGMHFLCKNILKTSSMVAHCAGLLFISNGFLLSHASVGHSNYMNCMLIPLVLALLYQASLISWIWGAVVSASFVYQGSYFTTPLLLSNILLFHFFFRPLSKKTLLVFTTLFILLCLGKLVGNMALVPHIKHNYILPYLNKAFNALKVTYSMLFLPPNQNFWGELRWGGQWGELCFFISPISLLPIVLYLRNQSLSKILFKHPFKNTIIFIIILAIVLLAGAWAPAVRLLHKIPVLNSYWVVARSLSILIVPFICVAAFCLENSMKNYSFLKPSIIACLIPLTYFLYFWPFLKNAPQEVLAMNYQVPSSFLQNRLPKMEKIHSLGRWSGWLTPDFLSAKGVENISCYDVTYGYQREGIKAHLAADLVTKIDENGYYNFINPACLLYGKENNCQPWDKIKKDDNLNLNLFMNNRSTTWKISFLHNLTIQISLISSIFVLVFLIFNYKQTLKLFS